MEIILATQQFVDLEVIKQGYIPIKKEFQTDPSQSNITLQLEKIKPTLGILSINTDPEGVKVFIDNEDTGQNTPANINNLQLNQSYKLVLKKEGYRSITQNVLIEKPEQELSIELQKITATLKIHTVPQDVVITLDDKNQNHLIEGLKLDQTYTVSVSKSGYTTVTKKVLVQNNYVELDIELKKEEIKMGSLSVSATPWAQVIVDGDVVGPSPILNHALQIGAHEVILRHPDFDDVKKSITIEEGQNSKIIIDLRSP
ncbi:MAG: PEGA domain-containing protein [Bdellovibrionota bacterium]